MDKAQELILEIADGKLTMKQAKKKLAKYVQQGNKETAILFMEWYGLGKTDIRIVPDAYDKWKSKQKEQQ